MTNRITAEEAIQTVALRAEELMLIRPPSRQQAPAEAHRLLPRSTQKTSIAELPIQQSGFIVDERSCAISFQAAIL